jgi:D-sedoheptulose 7-phosphate isomerase
MATDANQHREIIRGALQENIEVNRAAIDELLEQLTVAAAWTIETIKSGNKLVLFGNGGSAADAQHVAAEFVGRFGRDRIALPAIAITTDTSVLSAIGNDYGYDRIFSRQIEAIGSPGDLTFAFTTSGNSANVELGARAARDKGMRVIGLTGQSGGLLSPWCDLILAVPSSRTPRVQESHMAMCHALCEAVEAALFAESES